MSPRRLGDVDHLSSRATHPWAKAGASTSKLSALGFWVTAQLMTLCTAGLRLSVLWEGRNGSYQKKRSLSQKLRSGHGDSPWYHKRICPV